jgi:hypothetical protein
VVGAGRFEQRDGFGHGAALLSRIAAHDLLKQFITSQFASLTQTAQRTTNQYQKLFGVSDLIHIV